MWLRRHWLVMAKRNLEQGHANWGGGFLLASTGMPTRNASAVLTKENCLSSMSCSMHEQRSAGSSPQSTIPSRAETGQCALVASRGASMQSGDSRNPSLQANTLSFMARKIPLSKPREKWPEGGFPQSFVHLPKRRDTRPKDVAISETADAALGRKQSPGERCLLSARSEHLSAISASHERRSRPSRPTLCKHFEQHTQIHHLRLG